MTSWAILSTGPSMSQAVADAVRGRVRAVAVSDAYMLAPWADVLVSADERWWACNAAARGFAGRKFGAMPEHRKVQGVERLDTSRTGVNSGLLAVQAAVALGARQIILLGFDMHGGHFFGQHRTPLTNTTEARFEQFKQQFARYRPDGVEIVNCTPGSALDAYPLANLEDVI